MLQNNLLAEILDSKKRYSLEDVDNRRLNKKKTAAIPVMSSAAIVSSSLMSYDADVAYAVSVPKAHVKADTDSYMGTSHIEYEIEVVRTSDNEVQKITKRFREIREFYDTLLKFELIENNQGLVFPAKSLFEGGTVDPDSAFVQKRRIELQSFFRRLFGQNPLLFDHPKVINYFELTKFSFDSKTTSRLAGSMTSMSHSNAYRNVNATTAIANGGSGVVAPSSSVWD